MCAQTRSYSTDSIPYVCIFVCVYIYPFIFNKIKYVVQVTKKSSLFQHLKTIYSTTAKISPKLRLQLSKFKFQGKEHEK